MDGLHIPWLNTIWWPNSELVSLLSNKGRLSDLFMDVPSDGMTILIDASLDISRDITSDVSVNTFGWDTSRLVLCCWISSEIKCPLVSPVCMGNIPVIIGGDPRLGDLPPPGLGWSRFRPGLLSVGASYRLRKLSVSFWKLR